MNGYLVATSVALIATSQPELLTGKVRAAVERGPGFLSVISYWEVMVKSMKGMLEVGDPRLWFGETIDALALRPLLLRPEHVTTLFRLPPLHRDPFDRALIAQASSENLTLLTTDRTIPSYAPAHLRVIR